MTMLLAPEKGFAAAYDPAPLKNFVFLVPGDEELFVGGGALNGAVGRMLREAGQPIAFRDARPGACGNAAPVFEKEHCVYRKMHERLFARGASGVGGEGLVVSTESERSGTPVSFAVARRGNELHTLGSAFLNIFKEGQRPCGSPKNVGLLYTPGPLGRNAKAEGEGEVSEARERLVTKQPAEFLLEVSRAIENAMSVVVEYNMCHAGGDATPVIEVVRVPVISGGVFKHPDVDKYDVALAVIRGLNASLLRADKSVRPAVELMPDEDMRRAYDSLKEKDVCL